MQNSQGARLFGRNIFTDAFQQFDEQSFFDNLHNQVRNKSYFEKYRGFKTTLLILSYVFNLASALTAFYAAYWFTEKLTGLPILAWIVAALFLFFLEKLKRKSSSEFWQVYFFTRQLAVGWLALSLGCLGLSLASSGFGAKEGTEDLGPGAELIATDSTAQAYQARIDSLMADNARLEQQRTASGEIYWPAQQEKEENKKMIAALQMRILALDQTLVGKNELLSSEYRDDIRLTATTMIWVTIAMELLFEACIAWIWYYYYRSYVERNQTIPVQKAASPSPSSSDDVPIDPTLIAQLVAQELQRQQQHSVQTPSSLNGHSLPTDTPLTDSVQTYTATQPIGYFTPEQRRRQRAPEPPVQIRTELYKEEVDRFTVMHEYTRHGELRRTPYTRNQIQARINQYQRELEEISDPTLENRSVQNRQRWLRYWQEKMVELEAKIGSVQNNVL